MKKRKLSCLLAAAMAAVQVAASAPVMVDAAVTKPVVAENDAVVTMVDAAAGENQDAEFPEITVEVTDDGKADDAEQVTITTVLHVQGADGKEIGTRASTRSAAKGANVYLSAGNVCVGYGMDNMICRYVNSEGTAVTETTEESSFYCQTYGDVTADIYFKPCEIARLHVLEILCDGSGAETARIESAVREYNKGRRFDGFFRFHDSLPEGYYCTGVELKDASGNAAVADGVRCTLDIPHGGWSYSILGSDVPQDLYAYVYHQYKTQEVCRDYIAVVTEHFLDENGVELACNTVGQTSYTPAAAMTEQVMPEWVNSWGLGVMQYFGRLDHAALNHVEKEKVTYADLDAGAVNYIDYYYKAQSAWDGIEIVKRYKETSRVYVELGEDDDDSDYEYDPEQGKHYYIVQGEDKEIKSYVKADVAGLNENNDSLYFEDVSGAGYYCDAAVEKALCVMTDTGLEGYTPVDCRLEGYESGDVYDYGKARLVIEYAGNEEGGAGITFPKGQEAREVGTGTLTVNHHLLDAGGNDAEVKTYTKTMALAEGRTRIPCAVSVPGYRCSRYTYSRYEIVEDEETGESKTELVTGESEDIPYVGGFNVQWMSLYGDSVYDYYYTPEPDETIRVEDHYWDFSMETEYAVSTWELTRPYGGGGRAADSVEEGFGLYRSAQKDGVLKRDYYELAGAKPYNPSIHYTAYCFTPATAFPVYVRDHYTVDGAQQVIGRWEFKLAAGGYLNAAPKGDGCTKAVYRYYGADGSKKEETAENPSMKKLEIYGETTVDFYYAGGPSDHTPGGGTGGNQGGTPDGGTGENPGGTPGSGTGENPGGTPGGGTGGNPGGTPGGSQNNDGADQITVTYTVTFDKNGGSKLSVDTLEVREGGTIGKLPTAQRKKYTFLGWYSEKSGGTEVTAGTAITGNQTLYAHWEKTAAPKAANKPTLKNSKKGQIAVTYKAVKGGAAGYEIQYSTSGKFKKASVVNTKAKKATIKKLKKGRTYYVRVRAYNMDSTGSKVCGKYSKSVKLKVKK